MKKVGVRKRGAFLDRRSERHGGQRRLLVDGRHALPATRAERDEVKRLLRQIGRERGREEFFEVHDVARRIAGTGSLGLPRYVALVEGKGSPDQNTLLDLKLATPSAAARRLKKRQPRWPDEAQRVVAIQRRAQAVSPALLGAVEMRGQPWVLRELQPSEDRLLLEPLDRRALGEALAQMGSVVAWSHLRSSGRQGSAIADDWIEWSQKTRWVARVIDYSRVYRKQVERDWKDFVRATSPT